MIDLRSDTVTLPSNAMRDAMARADVGDDVYGEDPTVNRLQELAAERLGKEAALFVASGTMGNLISALSHCSRGAEVVLGDRCHIMLHEQGGLAALGGIFARTVANLEDGRLAVGEIRAKISDGLDIHHSKTQLICLENTWNGCVLKPDYLNEVHALAKECDVPLHLDGARVFNAAIALGLPVSRLVQHFDSVQLCFSKGLGAPVGSMICGRREFIALARRNRKLVGGGMRQAGILAAACVFALDHMVDRLSEDHTNAKALAEGLANCPGLEIDPQRVETNIVIFSLKGPFSNKSEQLVHLLKQEGVLVLAMDQNHIRAVTHYGIERADIEQVLSLMNSLSSHRQWVKV